MKKEVLSKAAKELDKLLFKTSQIKLNQKPEELQKDTEEASKELQSDDTITKETLEALTEIWKDRDGELTVKVCEIFRGLGILPAVEENKQEEDAEIVPDEDSLVGEINDAERIKDLKDIARSNDEFKAIRGQLNGYKELEDLRNEMLVILDGSVKKAEPEVKAEAEKEKAAEPAYVKKGNEKQEEPKIAIKETKQLEESNVVKGLIIGSKVKFTTAANSKIAPKKQLTGEIIQIKNCNKLKQEVVKIQTKVGDFYKTSKSITLV